MEEASQEPIKEFGKISEQVLQGVIQSIEAGVVLHDLELKVVFVNDSFERIFEISQEEVVGRSPMDFLPEFDQEHRNAILSRLQTTLETGVESAYHEFPYSSPSGKSRHLLAISIPIFDQDKKITHVMSVIHDLTNRKRLERAAVQAAKLSAIADMAYTLAHEINNPLTGIKLGLATLYESLQKPHNIQVLDNVMKDIDRIKNTVNRFLAAKKSRARLEKADLTILDAIVEDVLFHLSGQMALKNIEVVKRLASGEGPIMIDRDGIHQVLLNLLLNALQATPAGGKIVIASQVQPPCGDSEEQSDFLWLSVTDTGVGIDPQDKNSVFRPYYSSKQDGTGLGLTISKSIISAHRGLIKLDSLKNKGTTISICLPIMDE